MADAIDLNPAPGLQPVSPSIEIAVESVTDLDELAPTWRELEARADSSFFLSWHWIGAWLRTVRRPAHLIRAHLDGRVVGLGLLHRQRTLRHRILPVRELVLNASGREDEDVITIEYNGFLAERGLEEPVTRACVRHLVRSDRVDGEAWDALLVRGVEPRSIAAMQMEGIRVRLHATSPSAAVDLDAVRASGRPYLDHVSGNTRSQLRRSIKLYEQRGPLVLEAARDPAEAQAFLEECAVHHQARWQARGHAGAFASGFYRRFHRELIAVALPAGAVEVVRVSAGGDRIGYLYNFIHRNRVYFYMSGLRFEADNRLKPGLVTHLLCIERHLAAGRSSYDFMAGDFRYKTSLGRPGPDIVTCYLERPRPKLLVEQWLRQLKRRLGRLPAQGGAPSLPGTRSDAAVAGRAA